MKDVDLSHPDTADQKLISIYPLPGVGQLPYTTLDSPKPLFPGNTSMGIKQIAPSFIFHKLFAVISVAIFSVAITISSESAAQPELVVL